MDDDEVARCFQMRDVARSQQQPQTATNSWWDDPDYCDHSETITEYRTGQIMCSWCGLILDSILTDMFGNTLPLRNIKPLSLYRRKHHFNERLSQWLCLTRRVPDSILMLVETSLPNPRPPVLTKTVLRGVLRRLNLAKYIENWIEIHCHLSRRLYPVVSSEMIEKIRELFIKIEIAFEKHRPKGRKCILSYNYVLARIFQIFGLHEHLQWVPPLKSRAKLKYLDTVWSNMVRTLGMPDILPPIFNKSLR